MKNLSSVGLPNQMIFLSGTWLLNIFLKSESSVSGEILSDLINSDDLDEKMDLADEILMYIEIEYPDLYDEMEDDIRGLTLA